MKKLMIKLNEWFRRIKLAVFLHPEFDASRRVAMFGACALVAAVALSQVPEFAPEIGPVFPWVFVRSSDPCQTFYAAPWSPNMKFVNVAGGYYVEKYSWEMRS